MATFEYFHDIARLADDKDPALAELRTRLRPIVQKLIDTPEFALPNNQKLDPNDIVIHLSDQPRSVNAYIFTETRKGKTRFHIALTRSLLEKLKFEDILGGIFGHEIAHVILRKITGHRGRATKGEEAWADIKSGFALSDAGYNWKGTIELIKLVAKERGAKSRYAGRSIAELMDEHPLDGNRINIIDLRMSKHSLGDGGKLPEPEFTPIDPEIAEIAKRV